MRLYEQEEEKKEALIKALEKGELSGFQENVSSTSFLNEMKAKYGKKKCKLVTGLLIKV